MTHGPFDAQIIDARRRTLAFSNRPASRIRLSGCTTCKRATSSSALPETSKRLPKTKRIAPRDGDRLLGTHVADKTKRFHLDKRAAAIAAAPGDDDELLSTRQCADWLGVSMPWLEIGRSRGYGPPFVVVGPKSIRYRRDIVRQWLDTRVRTSTADAAQVET